MAESNMNACPAFGVCPTCQWHCPCKTRKHSSFVMALPNAAKGLSDAFKEKAFEDLKKTYFEQQVTALTVAVSYGEYDFTKELIEKGADVNAQSNESRTALYFAAKNGFISIVEMLIEYGAELKQTSKGFTALHISLTVPTLRLIYVNWPQCLDVVTNGGLTALMCMVLHNRHQNVKFLLEVGADPYMTNNEGYDCFRLAAGASSYESLKVLLDSCQFGPDNKPRLLELAFNALDLKRNQFMELLRDDEPLEANRLENESGNVNETLQSLHSEEDEMEIALGRPRGRPRSISEERRKMVQKFKQANPNSSLAEIAKATQTTSGSISRILSERKK